MIDINYLGHSCFKIRWRTGSLVIDPFNQEITGLKFPKTEAAVVLYSHQHLDHHDSSRVFNYRVIIEGPGEYEVSGAQITGIPSYHDDREGKDQGINIIYEIRIENLSIVHLGDLGHKLTDNQVELLNGVDILMIPVGGITTLEPTLATKVINQLEPLIVLPMHYQKPGLKIPSLSIEKFIKEIGKEKVIRLPKLSISRDKLPEEMQVVILD